MTTEVQEFLDMWSEALLKLPEYQTFHTGMGRKYRVKL